MTTSPAVEDAVHLWVARLEHVYPRIVRCKVLIERPHLRHRRGNAFHVRVEVSVPEAVLVSDRDTATDHDDVYVAVADAFEAAKRQLHTHADRQQSHHA